MEHRGIRALSLDARNGREQSGGDVSANRLEILVPAPPTLRGNARAAVKHRGSHLQIIASAGSGKTEVVSQRIADLLADGALPGQIVAFTFNEAAAEELKSRVEDRVAQRLGAEFLDRLNECFIGTIHAYYFRLLQRHVPRFEAYGVLDDHGLSAFLSVESRRLELKLLNPRLFQAIRQFRANVGVVENELLGIEQLTGDFRDVVGRYYDELELRRLLTYGQQISQAVRALETGGLLETIHSSLRHLVVDEYQDINPAQERLVELLATGPVELCVVGDDDQSIYQWRGADVTNILEFEQRYEAEQYSIAVNRRSRPGIVDLANQVSRRIQDRLPKEMRRDRPRAEPDHSIWAAPTEEAEAAAIAEAIRTLNEQGWRYADMAILVRGRVAYPALLRALKNTPVMTGAATGLFDHPLARLFGRTFAFLADIDWSDEEWGYRNKVELEELLELYELEFGFGDERRREVSAILAGWKSEVANATRPADLVGDYYRLLEASGVLEWNPSDPAQVARLGSLARCSRILADFESVQRRSRPDLDTPGEQIGGEDRGQFFFFRLATFVQNYAHGAYEGFEGEDDIAVDAVTLTTVHGAKGREWPIVFVPSLTARRFPFKVETGVRTPLGAPKFTRAFRRPRLFSWLEWGHSGANYTIKWSSPSAAGALLPRQHMSVDVHRERRGRVPEPPRKPSAGRLRSGSTGSRAGARRPACRAAATAAGSHRVTAPSSVAGRGRSAAAATPAHGS